MPSLRVLFIMQSLIKHRFIYVIRLLPEIIHWRGDMRCAICWRATDVHLESRFHTHLAASSAWRKCASLRTISRLKLLTLSSAPIPSWGGGGYACPDASHYIQHFRPTHSLKKSFLYPFANVRHFNPLRTCCRTVFMLFSRRLTIFSLWYSLEVAYSTSWVEPSVSRNTWLGALCGALLL